MKSLYNNLWKESSCKLVYESFIRSQSNVGFSTKRKHWFKERKGYARRRERERERNQQRYLVYIVCVVLQYNIVLFGVHQETTLALTILSHPFSAFISVGALATGPCALSISPTIPPPPQTILLLPRTENGDGCSTVVEFEQQAMLTHQIPPSDNENTLRANAIDIFIAYCLAFLNRG